MLRCSGVTKPVFDRIKKFLDENDVHYVMETHERVFTSEQAARARGHDLKEGLRRGAKAMILKLDDRFAQFVVPANCNVDMSKVRALFHPKSLRLAAAEEVLKLTHCEPGSVPPFGSLFNMKVYADNNLAQEIDFNAGLHHVSMTLSRKSWAALVKPVFLDIGEKK